MLAISQERSKTILGPFLFFGIGDVSRHTKKSARFVSYADVWDYHANISHVAVLEERLHAAG